MHTYTFHAIDTVTGALSHKAELNHDELDRHMLEAENKFWSVQVVRDDGNKVVFQIGESGQYEVYSRDSVA